MLVSEPEKNQAEFFKFLVSICMLTIKATDSSKKFQCTLTIIHSFLASLFMIVSEPDKNQAEFFKYLVSICTLTMKATDGSKKFQCAE